MRHKIRNECQLLFFLRDGLVKMQLVYQQSPQLGDPAAIEGQLRESVSKLQKLQLELQKYQTYLAEMDLPHSNSLTTTSLRTIKMGFGIPLIGVAALMNLSVALLQIWAKITRNLLHLRHPFPHMDMGEWSLSLWSDFFPFTFSNLNLC